MEISTNRHWSDPNVNIPTWKLTICSICANNWNHSLGSWNRVHRCKSVETGNFGRVRIHTELELPRIFCFATISFFLLGRKMNLTLISTIRCSIPTDGATACLVRFPNSQEGRGTWLLLVSLSKLKFQMGFTGLKLISAPLFDCFLNY